MKVISALLAILLLGCSGTSFHWTGVWIGDRGYKPENGENPSAVLTASQVKVTIKDNDTFLAEDGGVPIEGDVSYDGDSIHLKPIRVLGVNAERAGPPLNSPLTLHANKDGTATFQRDGATEKIVLVPSRSGRE